MEKDTKEEELHRKKAILKAVSGIGFGVLGLAFLFVGAIMQDKGIPGEITVPVILSGFLGCNMIGLVLLFKAAPELMLSDMIKSLAILNKVYEESELNKLSEMEKERVVHKLLQSRFRKTQEGYFVKKKFSLYKDFIYYYVCLTDDIGIENAIRRESVRFNQTKKKGNAFCLILLIWLDKIGETEKKELKEECKKILLSEYVFGPGAELIVAAIDESTHTGYYLRAPKRRVPFLYGRGCRLIEKIFDGNNDFVKM